MTNLKVWRRFSSKPKTGTRTGMRERWQNHDWMSHHLSHSAFGRLELRWGRWNISSFSPSLVTLRSYLHMIAIIVILITYQYDEWFSSCYLLDRYLLIRTGRRLGTSESWQGLGKRRRARSRTEGVSFYLGQVCVVSLLRVLPPFIEDSGPIREGKRFLELGSHLDYDFFFLRFY